MAKALSEIDKINKSLNIFMNILSISLSALAIKEGATRIENLESYSFE
jgi:hypothetical protein